MTLTRIATVLLALSLPMLGACSNDAPEPPPADTTTAGSPDTMIGRAVEKGMRQAREELETGNLTLNGGLRIDKDGKDIWGGDPGDGLPRAEITPKGDLLIDGKAIAIDSAQRAQLLAYRREVIGIAEAGMAIGTQGAELAGKALSEGLASVFGGDEAGFKARMEAEGKKIEAQAMLLCDRLPALLQAQDKLAASLPEFRPYARMTQGDVDECAQELDDTDQANTQARIREQIRSTIRKTVRTTAVSVVGDDGSGNAGAQQ